METDGLDLLRCGHHVCQRAVDACGAQDGAVGGGARVLALTGQKGSEGAGGAQSTQVCPRPRL